MNEEQRKLKVNDEVRVIGCDDVFVIVEINAGEAELMNRKGSRVNRLLCNLEKHK